MENFYDRTELLIGKQKLSRLKHCHILLFGLGGVGGYALEGLVRAGIENIDIVDNDIFSITNINRQNLATIANIGKNKTDEAIIRAKLINPNININSYNMFFLPDKHNIDFKKYDFVIDAIDTITAKFEIIKQCFDNKTPLISCMGTGNKLDATKLKITNIHKTHTCKVAKLIRKFCKDNNIKNLTVVYSEELSLTNHINENGRHAPASISYVPAVAGMLLCQHVILELIKD